ncbi:receptor-type tyrosine-protein phosphatase delta [Clonorchis sinensis]|uniref:Receptor-type tyrosine-protein phosphatase delta n=1 Tax=Clonorchis sinensis TaxID=79923 RepID=G7Y5E6_CLOSI|nr:receptor-type tyrosine-protein phosphatase delta [Clonorchis sinensis]
MPQGQKILVQGPTAVQVTWKGPKKRLTEVRHYKLMWSCLDCRSPTVPSLGLQPDSDAYYQDPSRVGQRKVLATYGSSPDFVYTATIGELIPNASYQIAVAAANLRGVGQSFVFPVVRTKHQAPMKPKNLHLVSIHKRPKPKPTHPDQLGYVGIAEPSYLSIELAWDPPDGLRTSQQITYQVFVRLVGPEDLISELVEQQPGMSAGESMATGYGMYPEGGLVDDPSGYHNEALNLHPLLRRRLLANVTGNTFRSTDGDSIAFGATYQFEVSLLNASVIGPSARLNVTTPDAPPSTSPLHVRLSGLSSSAVEISWAPPPVQYRNGRITAYQVRYFEVGAETQTETMAKVTVPGQRQHTAKDLKEKTFYTFMVRAFTSAGPGPWSGASNIRTSVELPPPPLDIRATRINQHQIKVTWRIPTGEELGAGSRHMSIQGFRLLYSSNNNPYEAGQWTSFDVAPISMSIISHLDSKTSYVICIKSRGPDGRYGDCSQPVISRAVTTGSESEFSVRNLYCTGDETSVKVTWQQPIRTKQLEGFKVRVGGSKRFADNAGVMRTLEFPARSMSVAYAAVHMGYTCTVSDLEPNSIYDVQLSAYYEMTLDMESNWETTSCYTQMQRPPLVPPPMAVAASSERRQVLLQLARVSERFGKIRHYFLVVAPVHLTDTEPEKIDIEHTITTSRGLPSSGTRYVAARYQQDYFDPPPRRARNFTLGALIAITPLMRHTRDMPSSTTAVLRDRRSSPQLTDPFSLGMDAEVNFDNKVLVDGQEYKAFVRACVFQNDHPIATGPNACTSSDWSLGFGPDRKIIPMSQVVNMDIGEYADPRDSQIKERGTFGTSGFPGNDLFVIAIVAVIVGLALVAVICIAFGCVMHRRRRPKLMNHLASNDPSMKQPLMRMNDCSAPNGTNLTMVTSGIDLMASNISAQNSTHLLEDKRDSYTTGHSSVPGSHIIPSSPPMGPTHPSLFSSITTAGRSGLATSGTGSPMTGMDRLSQQASGHLCSIPMQHMHPQTGAYPELTNIHTNMHPALSPFVNSMRGGTLSSHAGSHPSSITGPPSAIGSGGGAGSNLNSGLTYGTESGGICDGLVIARNRLPGHDGGQDQMFDMQPLALETKGPPMKHPIPISCLPDHVARLSAADNLLFSQEYESIETEQQFTWEHANMEVNKPKNRYANVIAYDHSRVILQSIDCVPGSDYINANYIDGYKRPNAYIATQGPMPETYSDFWRMIWEQRVFIIVMMTRLEERARIKCDQYWPTRGPEAYAGGLLTVTPVDTVELAYYTIRTFNLTARGIDDECREVKHFQFTSWPDHGVPEYPVPLLLFIRRIRATVASGATTSSSNTGHSNMIEQGPIVVHCSAGVGRTGAFIVIDMMLERIKYEKTVDIYGCVRALRSQRNFMVQTEDQYIFIHSALLEAVDAGNTEVPARNLLAHIKKLRILDNSGGSGMELEFKQLQQFRLPRAKYTSAQLLCNKNKNRMLTALPYESTRVTLQLIRGVEGSDYVNANFVDGYRERKAYIATQGPMAKTVEDFWRMVWELNSTIVVMLTKLCEHGRECCYPYWPSERSSRYQYYVVDPMVEYNMPNYTLREFKLTDARDGQSRTLRQFQFTDWPEQNVPTTCEPFIEFLGQVHKTKEQFGQDGPITVHCSNGTGRTGVFLTLSIVLERMRYEGVVDMFQTVRMLRTQRPGLVETEEQYQFCYNAALAYLASFDHYAT